MFYELFHDSFGYIMSGTVSTAQIASNFTNNLFKLTAALNEIFSVVFGQVQPENYNDLLDCFNYYEDLGLSVGQILRVVTGFTKTSFP